MAESKTDKGQVEGVEAGVHGETQEVDMEARIKEQLRAGGTVDATAARWMAEELGIVDEEEKPKESPIGGLTPATGSGGVPYSPEAASAETKKFAKEQLAEADKNAKARKTDPDSVQAQNQEAGARRLAAAVGVKSGS